jgi:hypothetical protein
MMAPLGFTGSMATGVGSPFDRNTVGRPPLVPLLRTGPYEETKGAFFMNAPDCMLPGK